MIIFTTFKELGVPETNAIVSWAKVFPDATIILFNPGGRSEWPSVGHRRVNTRYNLPLVNEMFEQVNDMTQKGPLLFINADCILTQSMAEAIAFLSDKKFRWLATGRRSEINADDAANVEQADWERVIAEKYPDPEMLPGCGADWFLFPRSSYIGCKMPPFTIARTCYDNWIIWDARRRGVKVIDCTGEVTVYHQRHFEQPIRNSQAARENYSLARRSYPDWNEWRGWIREADMTLAQMKKEFGNG